jgi:hypothetical protein
MSRLYVHFLAFLSLFVSIYLNNFDNFHLYWRRDTEFVPIFIKTFREVGKKKHEKNRFTL